MNQGFNPCKKAATLRLAGHRILSELYCYKCRISEYHPKRFVGNTDLSARKIFTTKIDSILELMDDIDLTILYLDPKSIAWTYTQTALNLDLRKFQVDHITYTTAQYIDERIVDERINRCMQIFLSTGKPILSVKHH